VPTNLGGESDGSTPSAPTLESVTMLTGSLSTSLQILMSSDKRSLRRRANLPAGRQVAKG